MLKLFYSYSHKNLPWYELVSKHLLGWSQSLVSEVWYDGKIRPGDDWNGQIGNHLDEADIILLLISPDYFASEYCGLEAERAMERHDSGAAVVIPIMLTHYNISGAAFARLQVLPAPDRPLSSWPKENLDQPLSAISRTIEERARTLVGTGPKNKLPHPNRVELTTLLYHLCDRVLQKDELTEALGSAHRKSGRPFLIFTRGAREDAHDRFVDRLEHILLPWVFREKPTRLPPLVWPEYRPRRTTLTLFGPRVADALSCPFGATMADMEESLRASTRVVLLPSRFYVSQWNTGGKLLMHSYVDFWAAWPQIGSGKSLIVSLSVTYGDDPDLNREVDAYLEELQLKLESPPESQHDAPASPTGVGGVVLSPFPEISEVDVKNWVDERSVGVLFKSPPKAITELSCIFDRPDRRFRMQPLGETFLPRWLDRL